MKKIYGNSRVQATVEKYEELLMGQTEPQYMDAYNKTIRSDGVFGCIRCGVNYRCMDFLIIPPNVKQQNNGKFNRNIQ